jgi:hypothetical protein
VQHQLPADGAVVLKLLLQPQATLDAAAKASAAAAAVASAAGVTDASSSTAAAAGVLAGEQQQQREVVRVVGKGKAALRYWLMSAKVTPWSNEDSLAAWAAAGAVIQGQQQQQQQQQQGLTAGFAGAAADGAAVADDDGALTVGLDGQQIESLEALLKQLLEANKQQDAAVGVAAGNS